MRTTTLLGLVIAVVVVVGVIGPGVFGTGASIFLGDGAVVGSAVSLSTASDSPDPGAFGFDVLSVDRCGTTCGEVTAALSNTRDRQATNVIVELSLFAGPSRDDGERIWKRTEPIGTLAPRETRRLTRQATVPISAVRTIERRDGQVTIVVRVESDGATTILTATEKIPV